MKHLKKFNESKSPFLNTLSNKEPLDVELDVDNFRKMFKSIMGKYNWEIAGGGRYSLDEHLMRISDSNPTLTDDWEIWGVYKINSSGRIVYSGYARAISKEHAKLKIAIYYKIIDIFTPKYNAEILSKEDIDGIIDSHEHEIYLIKNPI